MSNIVTVGYITEGTTDKRFLETIIKKTIEEIAYSCDGQIDVYDPIYLECDKHGGFSNVLVNAAKEAFENGIFILCIHTDSDNTNDNLVFSQKINPAIKAIHDSNEEICKIIVPIVPITMSESWMLADKELFKNEINTTLSDEDLNIARDPESIADPKDLIITALRVAQRDLPKRRFKLTISDLYQPIGQKVSIDRLNMLNSYKKFKIAVEEAFRDLNYLH